MRILMWFKKDLRIRDNPALFYAAQKASDGVIALYIIDKELWKKNDTSAAQINFILKSLPTLREDLNRLNISLLVHSVKTTNQCSQVISEIISIHKINQVYFNEEIELNEKNREQAVIAQLQKAGISTQSYFDQCMIHPEKIKNSQQEFFKIFTPYKKNWYKIFNQENTLQLLPQPKKQLQLRIYQADIPEGVTGFQSSIDVNLWPAGEKSAVTKLKNFIGRNLLTYDTQRNFPSLNATSRLSPYLATGMISARQCFMAAMEKNKGEQNSVNNGPLMWMSELIWRDFYRYIVYYLPSLCKHKPFKPITDQLNWNYDKKVLLQWQLGQTGFPIIDASMRQLNQTGWMHNRLRMVTAMFLSKILFLDWRLGEKYFSLQLIDCDFCSNNGGWQWSASTGTDAAPYFRVFNPIRQSEQYDPEGIFIRTYCPELKAFDAKTIHDPYGRDLELALNTNYPKPIVDYKIARERVIAAFKKLKK